MQSWKRKVSLFLASQTVTTLGSSLVQMAIVWHIARTTSSGIWVTLVSLCAYLPQMLISPLAGVWADRYSRKALIIIADSAIALATLALAIYWIFGGTSLVAILIIAAVRSVGSGIQMPSINAAMPQLVPEEHLVRANSILSTLQSVVQFASPALAAAILAGGKFEYVLLIDVGTAALGILMLAGVAIPRVRTTVQTEEKESVILQIREGLRAASGDKLIRTMLPLYAAFIFLSVPSGFLSALLIERTFGDSYALLSIAEMVGFAGMLLGGILLSVWGGFKSRLRTFATGILIYGASAILQGITRTYWVYTALMFTLSLAIPFASVAVTTLVQERIPQQAQGRVFGLVSMIFSGFMPLGMALFGPLADWVSIQTLLIITGAAFVAMVGGLRISRVWRISPTEPADKTA